MRGVAPPRRGATPDNRNRSRVCERGEKHFFSSELSGVAMKRPNKYGNQFTIVDGIRFDSKAEAKRWGELKLLERANQISELERQYRFKLAIGEQLIATYVADFRYFDRAKSEWVVEDVKGVRTAEFKIKARLMKALHRVEVVEVRA